jgi:hypothetical protein
LPIFTRLYCGIIYMAGYCSVKFCVCILFPCSVFLLMVVAIATLFSCMWSCSSRLSQLSTDVVLSVYVSTDCLFSYILAIYY